VDEQLQKRKELNEIFTELRIKKIKNWDPSREADPIFPLGEDREYSGNSSEDDNDEKPREYVPHIPRKLKAERRKEARKKIAEKILRRKKKRKERNKLFNQIPEIKKDILSDENIIELNRLNNIKKKFKKKNFLQKD